MKICGSCGSEMQVLTIGVVLKDPKYEHMRFDADILACLHCKGNTIIERASRPFTSDAEPDIELEGNYVHYTDRLRNKMKLRYGSQINAVLGD